MAEQTQEEMPPHARHDLLQGLMPIDLQDQIDLMPTDLRVLQDRARQDLQGLLDQVCLDLLALVVEAQCVVVHLEEEVLDQVVAEEVVADNLNPIHS